MKYEVYKRYRYDKGESYGIPYRSLVVRNFDNLLVEGRCVSCDHYVQASIRVMPGCYIVGQAAGTTAHLAAAGSCTVREIPVRELQRILTDNGCFLPNYAEV
nr:FAD-dependent oxidoreductase [uncultured Acetatifactor sp.]